MNTKNMSTKNVNTGKMNAEEMINRYVNEVGENLPGKSRADIEMELRSLIQDELDERNADSNDKPSAVVAAEVLREFGAPAEIAARYRPEEVLIGASLFPIYRKVLTITLSIIVVVQMAGLLLSLVENQSAAFGSMVAEMFASFWESILLNAGIVTLIFAIIERMAGDSLQTQAGKTNSKTKSTWDPYQLPPVKDPDRLNRGDLIAGIVVSLFLLGGLNFFFDSIGYIDLDAESRRIMAFFAPEFRQHIPWLTTAWALDVLLKMMVLVQGRWNRLTRWVEVGLDGFGLYVLARILMSDVIANVAVFTTLTKLTIGIIMVIVVIDMARKLYKLLVGRSSSFAAIHAAQVA